MQSKFSQPLTMPYSTPLSFLNPSSTVHLLASLIPSPHSLELTFPLFFLSLSYLCWCEQRWVQVFLPGRCGSPHQPRTQSVLWSSPCGPSKEQRGTLSDAVAFFKRSQFSFFTCPIKFGCGINSIDAKSEKNTFLLKQENERSTRTQTFILKPLHHL